MKDAPVQASRRGFFAGAAAVSAAATAVVAVPALRESPLPAPVRPAPPERGGGYVLSEHVKRYYKTTRV